MMDTAAPTPTASAPRAATAGVRGASVQDAAGAGGADGGFAAELRRAGEAASELDQPAGAAHRVDPSTAEAAAFPTQPSAVPTPELLAEAAAAVPVPTAPPPGVESGAAAAPSPVPHAAALPAPVPFGATETPPLPGATGRPTEAGLVAAPGRAVPEGSSGAASPAMPWGALPANAPFGATAEGPPDAASMPPAPGRAASTIPALAQENAAPPLPATAPSTVPVSEAGSSSVLLAAAEAPAVGGGAATVPPPPPRWIDADAAAERGSGHDAQAAVTDTAAPARLSALQGASPETGPVPAAAPDALPTRGVAEAAPVERATTPLQSAPPSAPDAAAQNTTALAPASGTQAATEPPPAASTPRPPPPPPARQVAPIAIALALGTGGAPRLTVALEPEELGRVEIRVERGGADGGASTVRIVAERPETLALLQRDARQLDRALQGAGIALAEGAMQFSLSGGEERAAGGNAKNGGGGGARRDRGAAPDAPIEPGALFRGTGLALLDIAI